MKNITEIKRLASPAKLPQSLAWDGSSLWMGSLNTKKIYQIDPETWTVKWETAALGSPWGMTSIRSGQTESSETELRLICGETAEDNRIIRRCIPGHGFDTVFKIPCPDDTGSQLGFDGQQLHVSQWYNKVVLAIGDEGQVERSIASPHGICGQVFVGNCIYLATTDAEETNNYFLTRIDLSGAEPKAEDIACIPFPARALAFDGQNLWTNHRANHEIVCFKLPD